MKRGLRVDRYSWLSSGQLRTKLPAATQAVSLGNRTCALKIWKSLPVCSRTRVAEPEPCSSPITGAITRAGWLRLQLHFRRLTVKVCRPNLTNLTIVMKTKQDACSFQLSIKYLTLCLKNYFWAYATSFRSVPEPAPLEKDGSASLPRTSASPIRCGLLTVLPVSGIEHIGRKSTVSNFS